MPLVNGKIYNVQEVLDLLEDLDSEDDVDISSERDSDEDENILDAMAAEQQKPQQEMSPSEDEQCNVYLCSPYHEGVTNISPIIDVTISTCTAEQAFSLPPPHISDGNHELSTDVVTDDVPFHSTSFLTPNVDFCISDRHTWSGKSFYGEPSETITTQSMSTSTPKRGKTREVVEKDKVVFVPVVVQSEVYQKEEDMSVRNQLCQIILILVENIVDSLLQEDQKCVVTQ